MAGAADGLYFDFEGQSNGGQQYTQPHQNPQSQHSRLSWPVPASTQHQQNQSMTVSSSSSPQMNMNAYKRSSSPLPMSIAAQHVFADASATANLWPMSHPQSMPAVSLGLDTSAFQTPAFDYQMPFNTSPDGYGSHQQTGFLGPNAVEQNPLGQTLDVNLFPALTDLGMPNLQQMPMNAMNSMAWGDASSFLPVSYSDPNDALSLQAQAPLSAGSPSDYNDCFESRSGGSDNGSTGTWQMVHHPHHHPAPTIFDPEANLHNRTGSGSSRSSQSGYDQTLGSSLELDSSSFIDVNFDLNSPTSDSGHDSIYSDHATYAPSLQKHSPPPVLHSECKPLMIPNRRPGSQRKSPVSPPSDRGRIKKTPSTKSSPSASAKGVITAARRATATNTTGREEKRVGRRKGPLNPDQRKQANEIRKLGACIRCRFLKKTCDKGDPCAGCQPSHARLWLVPCTRVDIKDLGYFLKGWKADYERHVTLNVSISNVKGFSDHERPLFVTHGYGHYFPISAREVYVRDDSVFGVNWVESHTGQPEEFKVDTARLSAGAEGVSTELLSKYLDMHVDGGFEFFVDEHFQGTPFVTEMLKIAYRFYIREKTPVIRKVLKLVLAYNLTQAILLVKGIGTEEQIDGKIEDARSEFNGEIAAPMMINFQVKTAMAELWRELQKEVLEDLSQLYSSIYSRDKLKHWPTIFMIASVLLVVWEEMQFDCRYRIPDEKIVDKFCHDMESTPVGVIVGLFSAISQKVPAFSEWDTEKHHELLGSNVAVCEAMESVRDGVKKHEKYLRNRNQAKFDRADFDSLSNMFVSKLVIRAH